MRVVTVMLVAALAGGFLLVFYQDYVSAAGAVSITRQSSPSANAAVTPDGDDNGFETNPTYAYADGTPGLAVDTDSGDAVNSVATDIGTDKHNYSGYGMDIIPDGSTILGITVRADIAVDSLTNAPFTAIRLSWDGGTTWTAVISITLTVAVTETTYTYGGPANDWGHAWSASELTDANFRVQVINGDTKNQNSIRDFSLDWIPVSITFTAPWESYSDSGHSTQTDDFFDSTNHVYMEGTGFPNGNYDVGYYDGTVAGGGTWVATDENITVSTGTLNSEYLLTNDQTATPGTWHALAQPASATPLDSSYATAVADPDGYELLANDSFTVQPSAIPEFPTVMAGIMVAGLCFGIYYWMRKRRLAYVKA